MTTQAAQLQFAAEFTLFLAALAAVAVTALRPDLLVRRTVPRVALVLGASSLAAGAFLHGSLLLDDADDPVLLALRGVGILATAVAVAAWTGVAPARAAAAGSLVVLSAAEVLVLTDAERLADLVRGVGALLLAVAMVLASRRAIAARVATSAAAVVLIVITALSLALSVVISTNIEDEAARRYEARAETESQVFADTGDATGRAASLAAQSLPSPRLVEAIGVVDDGSAPPEDVAAARQAVSTALLAFRESLLQVPSPGPLLVVGQQTIVADLDATELVRIELAGTAPVARAQAERLPADGIAIVGDQLLAVGAAPVNDPSSGRFLGVAVVTSRLGDAYLGERIDDPASVEQGVGLALADRTTVFSRAGAQPGLSTTLGLAGDALRTGKRQADVDGDRFVVSVPLVDEDGAPILAVTVNVPQARIDATRQDLFRLLFVVALGGALVAMVLAGYAGNRIGVGLAQLTAAAESLQQGRLDARTDLETEDELGVLGSTFNQMAFSLESLTRDLREAADAEAALRARLEGVVGGMGEALVAVDVDGRITDFNAAAEELVGVPARMALGRRVGDLCRVTGEDDLDLTARFSRPVLESWKAAGDLTGEAGEPVPVAVSAGPLRSASGTLTGAVFVVRDVRREREIEQMKSDFIANVSHELRTPLTPVMGYSEILLNRKDLSPEMVERFAAEIHTGARNLNRITNQLVQFATAAAGRLQLSREQVAPAELLDELAQRWAPRIPERIQLDVDPAPDAPTARLDRRYVADLLDELVDNATKYSPDGGRVEVRARALTHAGETHLLLAVSDEGVGIDPARREVIFDDFAQGDGSATRRFGGLGIGLALVSRLVRAHGGLLHCESELGGGTTVRVLLPLDERADPLPADDGWVRGDLVAPAPPPTRNGHAAADAPVSGTPVSGAPGSGAPGSGTRPVPATNGQAPRRRRRRPLGRADGGGARR